ncbi:MAG: cysteine desulfurase family protein, partial [Pseudomonadota bacterium]|nr:cysteine desulfurase family protein [Pseudomonadota bacterium]
IANLVNAKPNEIIFTSGGTEANNLALHQVERGFAIVSNIEHQSILNSSVKKQLLEVSNKGVVKIDGFEEQFTKNKKIRLISLMHANNETGILQPVKEVAALAKNLGILSHCDAIQSFGKVDVDWKKLGVDMMSISGHKLGGPQGVGALVVDENIDLIPMIAGGGQEKGARSGTENLAGAVGFGVAAELVQKNRSKMEETRALRNQLENELLSISPQVIVHGVGMPRLPNTSCISMPGVEAELQLAAFDLDGIMVSAGSACSSGKVGASHVLTSMNCEAEQIASAIRVSFGWGSSELDVRSFINSWKRLFESTRQQNNMGAAA